jgi:hypothetical protein
MKAEFTAHFFFTMLPYRITSPGMLWIPTRVAATICHVLSPLFNQSGTAALVAYADGKELLVAAMMIVFA